MLPACYVQMQSDEVLPLPHTHTNKMMTKLSIGSYKGITFFFKTYVT